MKCKPEEVPEEAVVEYARELEREWHRGMVITYGARTPTAGYKAEARRAIADGAEPSGWEWRERCETPTGPGLGWRLVRKPAPVPPDPVAEARRRMVEATDKDKSGDYYDRAVRHELLDATLAYIDAVAAKGAVGK